MADAYKGLTIEFAGDTTKLSAALSRVNGEVKTANGNLLSLNRALKIDPGNLSLMGDKVQAAGTKVDATKQRVDALTQAQAKLAASGDTTSATYQRVSREIETGQVYLKKYETELGKARTEYAAQESALGKLGTKLDEVGTKYGAAGTAVSKAGGVVLGATAAVAAASLAAFESVDTATDEAIRKTGATGAAADALSQSVKNVGASASAAKADWTDIGDTVGSVQVKFGVTGDALESLSEQFLEFGENTGTTAADDVETVAQAMGIFNVDASQTQSVLGLLQATYQRTGVSVSTLMSDVQSNGATFQEMGLNLSQSISLMGEFEQSGYDSTQMLAAMKKATAYFTAEGKSASDGIQDLTTRIQQEGDSGEAAQEAISVFGKKAGLTFIEAAAQGKISLSDLSDSLDGYSSTVSDTFDATEDGVDHAQQALKSLQETGATLGEALSDVMGPTLESVSGSVKDFADSIDSMSDGEKEGAGQAVIATAALAGVATVGGKVVSATKDIGEGLSSAAKFFAKVGGAADVAEGSIEASSVAMGVAKTGGIALATIALAAIIAAAAKAKEHSDELTQATSGLASAQATAARNASAQATSTDTTTMSEANFAEAMRTAKDETDSAIESQSKLTTSLTGVFQSADTTNGQLGNYQTTIDSLANKSGLSAQQQADLKTAVDNLNTSCGTAYTVVDAENGKIADQSGVVQEDTKAIDELVKSKQISNQADALSSAYKSTYEQQATDAKALTDAKTAQTQAQQQYDDALASGMGKTEAGMGILAVYRVELDKANQNLSDAQTTYDSASSSLTTYNDQLNLLTQAQIAGADSVAYAMAQNQEFIASVEGSGKSVSSLSSQLSDLGVTGAQMGAILADPTATDQLVSNYDGSETSVAAALASMGIDIDATAAESKASIADMSSSIQSLSDNGSIDLSTIGLSAHDLSQKLSDAGVTTQAQTAIANGAFAGMLSQSGGDIDALTTILAGYNSTPIVDKDGNITVNDTSLTDAQGNLYTWNGSTLVDKDGNAVVDDVSLTDAQGNVVTWNGSSLAPQSATATVDDSSLANATRKRDDWNAGSLWDKTATAIINFVSGGGAGFGGAGGGGAFASGGIIPSHADGGAINGIVTRRTLTNIGWVGEDGTEGVISSNAGGGAIIPLSNRHYVTPFARAVAEEMAAMTPRSAQRQSAASTRTSEQNVTNSVTVNQATKIIASDEDAYAKSVVINRSLMSAVTQCL